jgi:mannosyltransferase
VRAPAKTAHGPRASGQSLPPLAWVGVGVAVVAGTVARLLVDTPMWLDEALSVNIAELPLGDIEDALRNDGHPPLYYWMLHGWLRVVGDGDASARSLSVVFGLAALPLVWILGRRVGGQATAAWSVVLMALTPYAVRYSSEARMYSLLMVLVLAGAVLLPDTVRAPTFLRLGGVMLISAALLYTQYWSIYLLLTVMGLLVWRWRQVPQERRAISRVLAAIGVGGVLFLPWLSVFVDQARHTGTPWALPARPAQIVSDTVVDLGTGGGDQFAEGLLLGIVLAVLMVIGLFGVRDDDRGTTRLSASVAPGVGALALVAFVTLALGGAVGRLTGSAFSSRYAAVVVPFLLILAASGLTKLPRGWPLLGASTGVLLLSVAGTVKVVVDDRTEAADLAQRVAAGEQPGDVVIACPDQIGVALERALRQEASALPVLPYPDIDGDPRFVRWRDYEERNDAADPAAIAADVDARTTGAVWVAWNGSYRTFEGDCERLIASLGQARGAPEVVGQARDERAFEHADLLRFVAA